MSYPTSELTDQLYS